jgi:hypothetical protein
MKNLCMLFILLFVAGCVTAQITMLGAPGKYSPTTPDKVQVFISESDIKVPFEKIAIIHTQGESSWTNEQQMIETAKKKAAAIGADGIIIGKINEPSAGAKVAGAVLGVGVDRRGEIIAIKLKSE